MERPQGTKALAQGLEILRLLSESPAPLSATAIAERLGVSVSTASRALGALTAAGYVRKPDYHSFMPAIGVVALAGNARRHFGLPDGQRNDLIARSRSSGWLWTIGTVQGGQLIYLLRAGVDHEPIELAVGSYPLHLSVIALRLLVDLDDSAALEALRASRRRYGWERPTIRVPVDEAACLVAARAAMREGMLCLSGWQAEGRISVATPVPGGEIPTRILAVVTSQVRDPKVVIDAMRQALAPAAAASDPVA